MADFCTKCSDQMFGPDIKPDINEKEIFDSLPDGHYIPLICEGCGMLAIAKEGDKILFAYGSDEDPDKLEWLDEPKNMKIN